MELSKISCLQLYNIGHQQVPKCKHHRMYRWERPRSSFEPARIADGFKSVHRLIFGHDLVTASNWLNVPTKYIKLLLNSGSSNEIPAEAA
jgi:hypothetical protein